MHILFGLSLILAILAALVIGHALSLDYTPYATTAALLIYCYTLCLPFLGEYNSVNRTFSKIRTNFNKVMRTEVPKLTSRVDIILPAHQRRQQENTDFAQSPSISLPMIGLLIVAVCLSSYDLVAFYLLGEGLGSDTGPISNF